MSFAPPPEPSAPTDTSLGGLAARAPAALGLAELAVALGLAVIVDGAFLLDARSWTTAIVALPLLLVRLHQLGHASGQAATRVRSAASALGLTLALVVGADLAPGPAGPSLHPDAEVFFAAPMIVAATALVVRPETAPGVLYGLGIASGHTSLFTAELALAWPVVVLQVVATREWRRPLTFVMVGIAVGHAATSLGFDNLYVGETSGVLVPHPVTDATRLRMALEALVFLGGLQLLAGRTWALLVVVACAGTLAYLGTELAPHFRYPRSCMPMPEHALDEHEGRAFAAVALGLSAIWLAPVLRWLRRGPLPSASADESGEA